MIGLWLPHCLRNVRASYKVFIELDLPGQALDIIKTLTTDLRIQCLQVLIKEAFINDVTQILTIIWVLGQFIARHFVAGLFIPGWFITEQGSAMNCPAMRCPSAVV